jgi:hypothetical protein
MAHRGKFSVKDAGGKSKCSRWIARRMASRLLRYANASQKAKVMLWREAELYGFVRNGCRNYRECALSLNQSQVDLGRTESFNAGQPTSANSAALSPAAQFRRIGPP